MRPVRVIRQAKWPNQVRCEPRYSQGTKKNFASIERPFLQPDG
ncbi:hypothetical protein L810_3571 [Burkholderia sp. AU4i]|nr:hypothetical protein L810_3571 [Burkholderia sp. AU4i]